jgi:4-hydroxybenzoate polyprenyltransferase
MAIWHALRLLRPKQWVKNLFVFAPLLFAREFSDWLKVGQAIQAFGLFCAAASLVYVINDLRDVEDDRRHPYKSKTRPLASGDLSMEQGRLVLGVLGLVVGVGLGSMPSLQPAIIAYVLINIGYSYFARSVPVLDIFTIAIGFVLRVYAGALAIGVPVSWWMFVTTLCLALYLAALKRRHELRAHGSEFRSSLSGRLAVVVERFAEVSASLALISYSGFVLVDQRELVFTIPLVAYGLFRYWQITERSGTNQSPTEAMLKDVPLVGVVLLWVGVCAWVLLAGH